MRWEDGRRSDNVEDRRGDGGGRGFPGGLGGRMPGGMRIPVGRGGIGGLGAVAVIVIALLLGVDPGALLDGGGPQVTQPATRAPSAPARRPPAEDRLAQFASAVLADTEDTWNGVFRQMGRRYEEPTLVLFSGAVQSACGFAQSAVGPFYCPGDRKLYIDLGFFEELGRRFNAPGDFAQAYVIAHEVGHHVQTLLGIAAQVRERQQQVSQSQANQLQVRMELQADCLSGVWAFHAKTMRNRLEPGDLEEALGAAAAVGDDRLQKQARGTVVPDSFTHGTSAQRMRWFKRGFEAGEMKACDTFAAGAL